MHGCFLISEHVRTGEQVAIFAGYGHEALETLRRECRLERALSLPKVMHRADIGVTTKGWRSVGIVRARRKSDVGATR